MSALEEILARVASEEGVRRAGEGIEQGTEVLLVGLACSAKAMALAHLHRNLARSMLVVVPDREEAEAVLGDLEVCLGEEKVFFFAETEVIPYDTRSAHIGLLGERIPALASCLRGDPVVTVTTARALGGRLAAPSVFRSACVALKVGQGISLDRFARMLQGRGFRRERLVEEVGTFAVRGGLVDLYPFDAKNPLRVEFLGDEIESIRFFDPVSQRTVEKVMEVNLLPQRELLLTPEVLAAARTRGPLPFEEGRDPFVDGVEFYLPRFHPQTASLLDYFPRTGIVVLDEPSRLEEELRENLSRAELAHAELARASVAPPPPQELFLSPPEIARSLAGRPRVRLASFLGSSERAALHPSGAGGESEISVHRVRVVSQETFRGSFSVLRQRLRSLLEEGSTVYLLCDNSGQRDRLEEMLGGLAERIRLEVASLRNGFSLPQSRLVVLTDHELFARSARRCRAFRHGGGAPIHDYSALKRGDYVVHTDHGIGRYDGIHLLRTEGFETECLLLRYQEGACIYVPIDQINLVQKYVGGESGVPPQVARLGSAQWERTKARARKSVEKMARQLLEVHAARQTRKGHAFSVDSDWQREMEASFIYEETPDQRKATDAVKRDMMSEKPMDRLVCGDVGYGKTEVAIRAAFKAVSDNKQVAVLVPTTILAQQHLNTFRERLRAYPVVIEMLSRFRTSREQKEVVRALETGRVDIVIGTHRLLSKDVRFRDLGLVIVDEEQRFGVRHKERFKELRKLVDVMTLTATPIPRTLNMALMRLKDISVIDTPPPNKLPIVTGIVEATDEVVCKAILREIERGGQVFFVHNRVETIDMAAGHLRELLPELRFAVAHGQMPERQLEKVMIEFLERKSDVLVSTMIIESGLDLPNVNTILINRADRLGLSQLYQLRGRVGRSNHRAFAHLLVPPGRRLSEVARKRLRAIEEFSELGSGFRLAMRDMEIRGVGNFLGPEQSGHVNAIGYELYCRMLREAIAEMKGEPVEVERAPVRMDVEVDAYLPAEYIADSDQRIAFYKRFAELSDAQELASLAAELRDRYGRLPEAARSLVRLRKLRLMAAAAGVEELRVRRGEVAVRFGAGREPSPATVKEIVRTVPRELSFRVDGRRGFLVQLRVGEGDGALEVLEALLRVAGGSDSLSVLHGVE